MLISFGLFLENSCEKFIWRSSLIAHLPVYWLQFYYKWIPSPVIFKEFSMNWIKSRSFFALAKCVLYSCRKVTFKQRLLYLNFHFTMCFLYILLVQRNYLVSPYMEIETETANGLEWFSIVQNKKVHFSGKPNLAIYDKF